MTELVQAGLGLVDDVGLGAQVELLHGRISCGTGLAHLDTAFLGWPLGFLAELLPAIRPAVVWAATLQLLAQPLDQGARLRGGNAIRYKADRTQRPGDPGHDPIPATAPGPLLQFRQMSHHFLGFGADVLIGVMGVYPVPHRLHAGVLLGRDEAAHQLGIFPVTQDVCQAIVGQHFMAQDLAHSLGVGDGVGGHMQGAAVIIKGGAADQAILCRQPQRLLQLCLGGVDLHINATGAPVLLEPLLCYQLRLFAGQVLGWFLALRHGLFGETDPSINGIADNLARVGARTHDGHQAVMAGGLQALILLLQGLDEVGCVDLAHGLQVAGQLGIHALAQTGQQIGLPVALGAGVVGDHAFGLAPCVVERLFPDHLLRAQLLQLSAQGRDAV